MTKFKTLLASAVAATILAAGAPAVLAEATKTAMPASGMAHDEVRHRRHRSRARGSSTRSPRR